MIFRDRIVLKNGTVIMPENIDRVEVVGRGRSTIVSYDVERKNTYSVIAEEGMFRTDRPTGMVDSTGESWYYENDKVIDTIEIGIGTIKMVLGEWRIVLDNPSTKYGSLPLSAFNERFTITGMVPFGRKHDPLPLRLRGPQEHRQ
jgi:hypothetical protein